MSNIFVSHEPSGPGNLSENDVLSAINAFEVAFTSVSRCWTCVVFLEPHLMKLKSPPNMHVGPSCMMSNVKSNGSDEGGIRDQSYSQRVLEALFPHRCLDQKYVTKTTLTSAWDKLWPESVVEYDLPVNNEMVSLVNVMELGWMTMILMS
ncbi:hypothetical protein AVEN_193338-1 [Araneus ventricosus]|uniref:Uncharacterized protein n=1 Tax=Araneus ventricosus TaxID=182803 RepID=A0A4Y2ET53_ARAVE|nr:hypothetical protein AVEN_193338-1 [Araneus ventricosus]